MKVKTIYLSMLCLLLGCLGPDTQQKIVGNYYLFATDVESQMGLYYCDPAVPDVCDIAIGATVFAAGYNDKYIIIKQHPAGFPMDKRVTRFFIVPIISGALRETATKDLIGPLTLEEFNEKRKELNIPTSLKFTIEKEDLK